MCCFITCYLVRPRCPTARRRWALRQAYEVAATAGSLMVHSGGFNRRWLRRIGSDWTEGWCFLDLLCWNDSIFGNHNHSWNPTKTTLDTISQQRELFGAAGSWDPGGVILLLGLARLQVQRVDASVGPEFLDSQPFSKRSSEQPCFSLKPPCRHSCPILAHILSEFGTLLAHTFRGCPEINNVQACGASTQLSLRQMCLDMFLQTKLVKKAPDAKLQTKT